MIEKIPLEGGHPCLDFVNTVSTRYPERGAEYLNSLEDFVCWLRRIGFLAGEELEPMGHELHHAGERLLEQVITIREALYAVFRGIAEENQVSEQALAAFNTYLRQPYEQLQLERTETGLRRAFANTTSPYLPIWHLLLLAEELLLQYALWPRIRACPSCGWLFLDTSKNGRRRWCNMQVCGSQVKARRWYHRNKGKE